MEFFNANRVYYAKKKKQISYSDISNCFYMPNYNFFAVLVRRVLRVPCCKFFTFTKSFSFLEYKSVKACAIVFVFASDYSYNI